MTAVEWLENEIGKIRNIVPKILFEQAKEMEREQLKKERLEGYVEGINSASTHYPD